MRLISLALLCVACHPIERDPVPEGSSRVVAIFAPDAADPCLSVLPFPTDLAKSPVTGLLEVPYCVTDAPEQVAIKTGLRTLDGYPLFGPLSFRLSDAVAANTVGGAATLFELDSGARVELASTYLPEQRHTVLLRPSAPLKAATRYAVVVSDAIRDLAGAPIVADQAFTFLKSDEPLVDAQGYSRFVPLDDASAGNLEAIRQAYQPVFAVGARFSAKQEIALAWFFTTQSDPYAPLGELLQAARTAGGARISHESATLARDHLLLASAGVPTDALCAVHAGRITVRSFLGRDGLFVTLQDGGTYQEDAAIDYLLVTPRHGVACDAPAAGEIPTWNLEKLAVFSHGLGRCKNDALALANLLAARGWATLSLDGPRAGARVVDTLGDQDLDGCADQPATPELLALGGQSPNPFLLRDQLRQWALELAQVIVRVQPSPAALAGQLQAPVNTQVALVGHSWGGVAATLAGGLVGPYLAALAVNATPADLGAVFAPLVTASTAAGLPSGTPAGEVALAAQTGVTAFGWALEAADPLVALASYPQPVSLLPVLVQVIDAGDTPVSLHATAEQLRLLYAFDRHPASAATFVLAQEQGGARVNLCDLPTLAVGSLLQPCVAEDGDAARRDLAVRATLGLQRQLGEFVDRRVICSPDASVACN